MTSQQILQADLLDILFERRNKAYGAYSLRKAYHSQLRKATGLTLLLVLLLLLFGSSAPERAAPMTANDDGYTLREIETPTQTKPVQPKPPAAAPQPVKTDILLDRMKIVDDPQTPVATQEALADAQPGSEKLDGPPALGPTPPVAPVPSQTGMGEGEKEAEHPPLPSRQPQFPGGTQAWLHFLGRFLQPPADLAPGEKRSVLVRFSVDQEGLVTNFVVVQSGGADFDNEVIRVLKKMPRWLPAIQNGKPVAVSFTQPVTFAAADE